jgi:TetR/AcrR family transcriptional regulator, transcriptional repressor for nem operon
MPSTGPIPTAKGRRTRERILQTAADLFHERGINATTVGDVLRASATGKGQFYQHFPSREALVNEVLERHRAFLAGAPPIRSWEDLRGWLLHYLQLQHSFAYQRGCPVGTAAYALQPDQDRPRSTLKQIFDHMRQAIAAFLAAEQEAGRLRAGAEPRRLADFTVAAVQGAMLLGLLDRGPAPARAVVEETYAHLVSHRTGGLSPEPPGRSRTPGG